MIRGTAIMLLLAMGMIANQLPMVWLSYKTVSSRYATFYCVNPDTDCNGSCSMKRTFIETQTSDEEGQIPQSVVNTVQELSPYLSWANTQKLLTSSTTTLPHHHTTALASCLHLPPLPPPKA